MKIIWLWDLVFEKTQIGLLNINFPKLSSCMYSTLKLQKHESYKSSDSLQLFSPKLKYYKNDFFRPENVNEICFVLGHNGRLLLADHTFCCSFTSFPSEPAVTLWGHLSAHPKPLLHKALLGSAGSESCRQTVQMWARLQNQGNIFRQKYRIFSDKNVEYFQTKMLKNIWKDWIRIFSSSSPIAVLWWWQWQPYTLISQSLNFVVVLVSQSLNSCGQVILKLEPRAPFQLHKWQPFRRSVKEVKCTFTVHFAGTGIEVIFQSSDRWRAKLSCSIFSQTLNPLSDGTGPSV